MPWSATTSSVTRPTPWRLPFLDVLRPVLREAGLDAYSDFRDSLPPAVEEAQEWLRQRGRRRGRRDPGMDVRVPVEDEQGWTAVRAYAARSSDAEFFGEPDELLLWLHHGASSVTADLTEEGSRGPDHALPRRSWSDP